MNLNMASCYSVLYKVFKIIVGISQSRDLKVIILGSANVGKTCLLQRYLTGNFNADTISVGPSSLAVDLYKSAHINFPNEA